MANKKTKKQIKEITTTKPRIDGLVGEDINKLNKLIKRISGQIKRLNKYRIEEDDERTEGTENGLNRNFETLGKILKNSKELNRETITVINRGIKALNELAFYVPEQLIEFLSNPERVKEYKAQETKRKEEYNKWASQYLPGPRDAYFSEINKQDKRRTQRNEYKARKRAERTEEEIARDNEIKKQNMRELRALRKKYKEIEGRDASKLKLKSLRFWWSGQTKTETN